MEFLERPHQELRQVRSRIGGEDVLLGSCRIGLVQVGFEYQSLFVDRLPAARELAWFKITAIFHQLRFRSFVICARIYNRDHAIFTPIAHVRSHRAATTISDGPNG